MGYVQSSFGSFHGVAISPNTLEVNNNLVVNIPGFSDNVAKVLVKQGSEIILETMVESGPYELQNIRLENSFDDVVVALNYLDGNEVSITHNIVELIDTVSPDLALISGISQVSVGKFLDENNFAAAISGYANIDMLLFNRQNYQLKIANDGGVSYRLNASGLFTPLQLNYGLSIHSESSPFLGTKRDQVTASMSYNFNEQVSARFYSSLSRGERLKHHVSNSSDENTAYNQDIDEIGFDERHKQQVFGLGISVRSLFFENDSFNISYNNSMHNSKKTTKLNAHYSLFLHGLTIGFYLDGDKGELSNLFSLNLTVPFQLGANTLNTYVNHNKQGTTLSARGKHGKNRFSTRVKLTDNLKQLNNSSFGYTLNGRTASLRNFVSVNKEKVTHSASLSGGVVLHNKGVALSPQKIPRTFSTYSILDFNSNKLSYFDGVHTQITPYKDNVISYQDREYDDYDKIINSVKVKPVGNGATHVNFIFNKVQRALVLVKSDTVSKLENANIYFDKTYVGMIDSYNQVFINDVKPGNYKVTNDIGDTCYFSVNFDDLVQSHSQYFLTGEVLCD